MLNQEFLTGIGILIHECGSLELLTNGALKKLDPSTSNIVLNGKWANRIDQLKMLLAAESKLSSREIDDLSDRLHVVRQDRNNVAHGPLLMGDPADASTSSITTLKYTAAGVVMDSISLDDLRAMVSRATDALRLLVRSVPGCTSV